MKKQNQPKDRPSKSSIYSKKPVDAVWERLVKIGEEIDNGWQSEKSAVEILSEMRR